MEVNQLNVKAVKKFSIPKMIHILISLAITVLGIVLFVIFVSKDETTSSQRTLSLLWILITIFGVAFLINALLLKDKHYVVNGHNVRCYNGAVSMLIEIDDEKKRRQSIFFVKSKDLEHEVSNLKVRLHVNGWGAIAIFFNDRKVL